MDTTFYRQCNSCSNMLHYKNEKTYNAALKKGTMCPSCRTSQNNKSSKRNAKGNKNPSWKGYKEVPGKTHSRLKRDAIKRDIYFHLTIEEISDQYEKQSRLCAFTGIPLKFGIDASVDRIDSNLGYEVSNIQIVHKELNMMKKDMPNSVFIEWCKLVSKYEKE